MIPSSFRVHSNRQDAGKHKDSGPTAPASHYVLTTDKILQDIAKKEWEAAMNQEDEEEQKVFYLSPLCSYFSVDYRKNRISRG